MEKLNTFALMGKGPLNSVATKDKGKATITAIKYSAPDRAMFFNFYNHPQPLWVWANRTNISPRKLNLHMDVGGRVKTSIKRKEKQFREGGDKSSPRLRSPKKRRIIRTLSSSDEVQKPKLLRPCRGESLLRYVRFTSVRPP